MDRDAGLDVGTIYYGASVDFERSAVVALSQSGRTPDVVEYVVQAAGAAR